MIRIITDVTMILKDSLHQDLTPFTAHPPSIKIVTIPIEHVSRQGAKAEYIARNLIRNGIEMVGGGTEALTMLGHSRYGSLPRTCV